MTNTLVKRIPDTSALAIYAASMFLVRNCWRLLYDTNLSGTPVGHFQNKEKVKLYIHFSSIIEYRCMSKCYIVRMMHLNWISPTDAHT